MKRTTKYVGLDVHQASTVASVREASGRVIARSVVPTEGGALTEFLVEARCILRSRCDDKRATTARFRV